MVPEKVQTPFFKIYKENDGVAYHHHSIRHKIDFENVDIITQEKSYWRRLIREGIEIKKLENENRPTSRQGTRSMNAGIQFSGKRKHKRHGQEFS